eukprot:jgi/Chlat1/7537/Chrsp62S07031
MASAMPAAAVVAFSPVWRRPSSVVCGRLVTGRVFPQSGTSVPAGKCVLGARGLAWKPAVSGSQRSSMGQRQSAMAGLSTAVSYEEEIAQVMPDLANVSVYRPDGSTVRVGELWDQQKVIATFCWELASSLLKVKPLLDDAGVKLVVLSVGKPESAVTFCERVPFPTEHLYADPDKSVYDTLKLYRSLGRTFANPATPKALLQRGLKAVSEAAKNYTLIMPAQRDDAFQQGGMFIFEGQKVLFAHRDEGTADHAKMKDILTYCCGAETYSRSPVK